MPAQGGSDAPRRHFVLGLLALGSVAAASGDRPAMAQSSLHLVLTPSQKPTDLLAAGEEFGRVLGEMVGRARSG